MNAHAECPTCKTVCVGRAKASRIKETRTSWGVRGERRDTMKCPRCSDVFVQRHVRVEFGVDSVLTW